MLSEPKRCEDAAGVRARTRRWLWRGGGSTRRILRAVRAGCRRLALLQCPLCYRRGFFEQVGKEEMDARGVGASRPGTGADAWGEADDEEAAERPSGAHAYLRVCRESGVPPLPIVLWPERPDELRVRDFTLAPQHSLALAAFVRCRPPPLRSCWRRAPVIRQQCSAAHRSAVQRSAVQCSAVQCAHMESGAPTSSGPWGSQRASSGVRPHLRRACRSTSAPGLAHVCAAAVRRWWAPADPPSAHEPCDDTHFDRPFRHTPRRATPCKHTHTHTHTHSRTHTHTRLDTHTHTHTHTNTPHTRTRARARTHTSPRAS